MGIVEQFVQQLNKKKQRFRRTVTVLTVLSLVVMMTVTWNLRQTGITLANDASCGYKEHQHNEECPVEKVLICNLDFEGSTEEPVEPSEAPEEETTEPPMGEFTEEPTEETSEPSVEESTEEPTEETTESPAEELLTP